MLLERQPDQHHRHPRARRLHRRGGAQPARARRRRGRLRRQGGCRAAVRAGLAAGRQVRRPAHLLRQQDGQDRRRLLLLGEDHGGAPRRQRHPDPAADRLRGRLRGHRRPGRDERQGVARRDEARRDLRDHRDPGRAGREGRRVPHQAARGRRRDRRDAAGEVLRRRRAHGRGDQGRHPQADHQLRGLPGAVRQRVQEQGRAAHAGRRHRLPALAAGRAAGRRPRARQGRRRDHPQPVDRRAVLRAGVQGRDAPVLRQADLRPGVLGQGRLRQPGHQRDQGQEGAAGQAVPDALQQGEPGGDRLGRSHLRGDRSEGHHHR